MKSIAVVLIVFGLVATGIGVYFVRQSRLTQTQIQAAPQTALLGNIIDDCALVILPNCPDRMKGQLPLVFVPKETEKIVREHAHPDFAAYTETLPADFFVKLGHAVDLPVKPTYTTAEIIARVSLASDVDDRMLIAMLALQGSKAWNEGTNLSNPFGRKELSFADQLAAVAIELRSEVRSQLNLPTNSVVNYGTNYPFATGYVSTASKAVYGYLARSSNSADFARAISLSSTEPKSFRAVWQTLFPSANAETLY